MDLKVATLTTSDSLQVRKVKNDKLRFILHISHFFTCESGQLHVQSADAKSNRIGMEDVLKKVTFSNVTKECIERQLADTLYDVLCADDREENMDKALEFTLEVIERMGDEDLNGKWGSIKIGIELFTKFKTFIYKYIMDPLCPSEKPSDANRRSTKERRQFGVIDILHTLENVYCDPVVVRGIGRFAKAKHKNTHSDWLFEETSKYWCCLVKGEWEDIIAL